MHGKTTASRYKAHDASPGHAGKGKRLVRFAQCVGAAAAGPAGRDHGANGYAIGRGPRQPAAIASSAAPQRCMELEAARGAGVDVDARDYQ